MADPLKLEGELVDIAWRGDQVRMTWSAGNLALIRLDYDPETNTGTLAVSATPYTSKIAKAAFEKALGNMQALAESAQKANSEAYEIVSARVQESMQELRDMASNLTKS